jgi:hypothetical protein
MGRQETPAQMQRGKNPVGTELTDLLIGRHEVEMGLTSKVRVNADSAAKVIEVRATAHADVLTCIDELACGGILKRTGPTAGPISRFENGDLKVL